MFEKEAEEIACKLVERGCVAIEENRARQDIKYTFQKGAEFGYNKAKEEMQENGLALQSDMDKTIEQNLQLKKELNKANEWHKVADGDLPKIGKTCLVYLANGDVITARLREDNVWTTNGHNAFENVIAWKEIVLPKEIEK